MKLLFLDIDGVMNSNSLKLKSTEKIYPFSEECVIALNEVLKLHKVKIILTSSWRNVFDAEKQGQIFKENGVNQIPKGQTKDLGFENRSMEIQEYLKNKEVESFVILDDMLIEGFDKRFVRVNPKIGLSQNHIQIIDKILNIKC